MRKRQGKDNGRDNNVRITERKQKEKAPLAATPEFKCIVVFRGLFPCGLNFVFYVLFFADFFCRFAVSIQSDRNVLCFRI